MLVVAGGCEMFRSIYAVLLRNNTCSCDTIAIVTKPLEVRSASLDILLASLQFSKCAAFIVCVRILSAVLCAQFLVL